MGAPIFLETTTSSFALSLDATTSPIITPPRGIDRITIEEECFCSLFNTHINFSASLFAASILSRNIIDSIFLSMLITWLFYFSWFRHVFSFIYLLYLSNFLFYFCYVIIFSICNKIYYTRDGFRIFGRLIILLTLL